MLEDSRALFFKKVPGTQCHLLLASSASCKGTLAQPYKRFAFEAVLMLARFEPNVTAKHSA